MPTTRWNGDGVADGTAVDNTNVNATGNGDLTLTLQAITGTGARTFRRNATYGDGMEVSGSSGGFVRTDSAVISGGAPLQAVQFVFQARTVSGADDYIVIGRSTSGQACDVRQRLSDQKLGVYNSVGALIAGALAPALVDGHYYLLDLAMIQNTLTTPTTSNGRVTVRLQDLTDATWNTSGVFYFDSGYAVNVTVDLMSYFRFGKLNASSVASARPFLKLARRDSATVSDTTASGTAGAANFVQASAPAVTTTGTGRYPIVAIGTPAVGGALSYSITQTGGTAQTPTAGPVAGTWFVDRDSAGTLTYQVTVTEAGGSSTTSTFVVPQATTGGGAGQILRRGRFVSGAWVLTS